MFGFNSGIGFQPFRELGQQKHSLEDFVTSTPVPKVSFDDPLVLCLNSIFGLGAMATYSLAMNSTTNKLLTVEHAHANVRHGTRY